MKFQWFPDIVRGIVDKVKVKVGFNVFFDYGHYEVVTDNLQAKADAIKAESRMKYPIVWLKMDFPERVSDSRVTPNIVTCSIVIATATEPNYTMDQRRDITFLPVLYPILEALTDLSGIDRGGLEKWDHPYWGVKASYNRDNDTGNLFNDFVDAIELRDVKFTVKRNCIITT